MAGHIDVHFHALPPAYKAAVKAHAGDPSGFPEADWSPETVVSSLEAGGASLGDCRCLVITLQAVMATYT